MYETTVLRKAPPVTSKHSSLSRHLRLVAAGTTLIALAACGGPKGADAPTDASVDDFCAVIGDLDLNGDASDLVDALSETGTPQGIPDDARAGFEVMIDEATAEEISDADQEKVSAFIGYVGEECGAAGLPGE